MTLEALADQWALQRLVIDYADAIDHRDFDRLDQIFTADAYIDYRAMGGIDGRYPEIKTWLVQALAHFPQFMHLVGNLRFDVNGDVATGRVSCFNPMVLPETLAGTEGHTMFLGLWYDDEYRRTPEGWRVTRRVERKCYAFNVPDAMRAALATPQPGV
ncbi:nuclear transport factor 2 family protein [Polycyclovorans algicola]|uniref:nuclear transport factor 2 family protein n=1 Tax=Polycyclovorans algicola TaxID=616992 RepID=UPI0004A6C42B|nr:nuclear transport factor 2 family protein [Polycyclovorans algicola]